MQTFLFLFAGLVLLILGLKVSYPYKYRYMRGKLYNFFGRCEKCGAKLNYTSKGRSVCPNKLNHEQ